MFTKTTYLFVLMLVVLAMLIFGTTATAFAEGETRFDDPASMVAEIPGARRPPPTDPAEQQEVQVVSSDLYAYAGYLQEAVPLYSQLDNGGTEWTSCGPTALAMALNYLADGPTPQEIIQYAVGNSGTDGIQLYDLLDPDCIYTSPQHLYEIADYYGNSQTGWVTSEDEAQEKLRELLSADLPVIVDVTVSLSEYGSNAAHFVVVTGIGTDNTVYINDPYGEGQGGQVRSVSWDDFYWSWQNNSDGSVGGHGWWMVVQNDSYDLL